jgi:NitT/TauT family transport system substrate-binding protein
VTAEVHDHDYLAIAMPAGQSGREGLGQKTAAGSDCRAFFVDGTRRSGTMMKTVLAAAILALAVPSAEAADKVTLQLKWVTQAQFAGYYVAKDKGLYEEAGLDVTINPGGPDIAPPQVIAGGGADVIVDWMPSALASREKGVPLVNVAQPFKRSGMELTCRKDTGITKPEDFRGKTLGVWFYGNEYPFLSWMAKLGIPTNGSAQGVKVLKQGFNVDPLLQKQADCISTMTYNEYWQVIDAGIKPEDLIVFKYEDQGVATLEDGLYVAEANLKDPAFVDKIARFVAASMKGWAWARENPQDAAQIVLDNDATGAQTEKHQVRMMGEINKLTVGSDGVLDPADYERTVQTLLSGGSDPVITKAPAGAWTHAVTDAAKL